MPLSSALQEQLKNLEQKANVRSSPSDGLFELFIQFAVSLKSWLDRNRLWERPQCELGSFRVGFVHPRCPPSVIVILGKYSRSFASLF